MVELKILQEQVENCKKCDKLVSGRLKTVFGEGPENTPVMMIGEAPGKTESETGKPFCGPAGKLLTNILQAYGLSRENFYICNMIKCRPPNNRVPLEQELCNCREFLDKQIELVNPKVLFLLGSTATKAILSLPVTVARGNVLEYQGKKVVCTYHPSALLHIEDPEENRIKRNQVCEDMKILLTLLKK